MNPSNFENKSSLKGIDSYSYSIRKENPIRYKSESETDSARPG